MPRDNFEQRKETLLSKQDKSSKGCWDERIRELCDKINKQKNYYTTSSCSGRVVILADKKKKGPEVFLKVYHDKIKLNQLKNELNKHANFPEAIRFKQEPVILHIACKTLEDAKKLLSLGQKAGLKRSGIVSSGERFIVELNATDKLEFFIMNQGKIIVTNPFLELIVKRSNENLESSWDKIEKLEKLIK